MKLPIVFKNDIQSNDIQLIPLLVIERDSNATEFHDDSDRKSLSISTHDITVHKASVNEMTTPFWGYDYIPNGMHFDPLLLENPIINEKIDVENRQYTISTCTFKISNCIYNGQRFSDMLSTENFIGKKVHLAYKSINSLIPIYSYDIDVSDTFSYWYDQYSASSPTFYYGEIIDIKHDNEQLTITAEDISSTMLHQEIPKNSLPSDSSVMEQYRGSPIPMVYGYMPTSKAVMGRNKKVYADSRPIGGWFRNNNNIAGRRYGYPFSTADYGALFIYVDDHLCSISNTKWYELQQSSDDYGYVNDEQQVLYEQDDVYDTEVASLQKTVFSSANILQLIVCYKPTMTLQKRNYSQIADSDDFSEPEGESLGDGGEPGSWGEDGDLLTDEEQGFMTDGNWINEMESATSDTAISCYSEAMLNSSGGVGQFDHNNYKHSLFRFIIDTEPPIEYVNRGGIAQGDTNGMFSHWISFGHWVMPNMGNNPAHETHSIYTSAMAGAKNPAWGYLYSSQYDKSWLTIRKRYDENGVERTYGYTRPIENYGSGEATDMTDGWSNRAIQLGDVIQFSDFVGWYEGNDWSNINKENQQWWHFGQMGNQVPLEFFGFELIDESGAGTHTFPYVNPYARYTNNAKEGEFIIELGLYGWIAPFYYDIDTLYDNTDGFQSIGILLWNHGISDNMLYKGFIRGFLPETTCMSVCDTKVNYQDMYGSVKGRVNTQGNLILHPVDMIIDIFVNELGHDPNKIDYASVEECKSSKSHENFQFSFTQAEKINSKELIEDIAKSTFIFPRIGYDGVLKFKHIQREYEAEDFNEAIKIHDSDIISYKYKLTKRSQLATSTDIKYNYNHKHDSYFGDHETSFNTSTTHGTVIQDPYVASDDEGLFHGIEDVDDHIKTFESKYLTSYNYADLADNTDYFIETVRKFQDMHTHHYRNRHLIITCRLPLRYVDIEVGDHLLFPSLIDGVKAYGIDYTDIQNINNQWVYPLFMCNSIRKSIEYIEIECIQLHHLAPADIHTEHYNSLHFDIRHNFDWYTKVEPVYHDALSAYVIEPPEDGYISEDTGLEIFDELEILSSKTASYQYDSFLIDEETPYPYEVFISPTLGSSEWLYIMQTSEGYNFADPDTGIHKLFPMENFKYDPSGNGEYIPFQHWQELLGYNSTDTVDLTMIGSLTAIEIHHTNNVAGYHYIYRVMNTAQSGDTIQMNWVLDVVSGDNNYDDGKIFASPFGDWYLGGGRFEIKNTSNYNIKYDSPHAIALIEYGIVPNPASGDVNADGVLDILDVVGMVNFVMSNTDVADPSATDINQDGTANILDAIILINMILEGD